MCKEHTIARGTVKHFIKTKNEFTFQELKTAIVRNEGIMRVSMGVSVSDYLENFESDGVVKQEIRNDDVYYKVVKLS